MGTEAERPAPRKRKRRATASDGASARSASAGSHDPKPLYIAGVIVLLATLFAHLPAVDGDLLGWDDRRALLDFTQWRGLGWSNIQWAFTTTAMAIYRPLTWLTYGLDYTLTGLDPYGFHRTNLVLHVALAGSLYWLLVRWLETVAPGRRKPWPAALCTLAWSVHPLRVQAVAWVSARADLLAGFFLVLATVAWLGWTTRDDRRARVAWHALYAASLLSKPVALGAPIAWWLTERWLQRRGVIRVRERSTARSDRVLSFMVAGAGAVAILIAKGAWTPSKGLPALPASAAFVALHNAMFPLYTTLWPAKLGYYEPRYPFDPFAAPYVVGGIAALIAAASIWRVRRKRPGLVVAAVSYLALLGPMLGIVPFGYELVADRFSFVPALVWSVALAAPLAEHLATSSGRSANVALAAPLATSSGRSANVARAVAVVVLVVLGFITREQTQHWKTSRAFWKHNYEIDPQSGMANSGMGDAMLKDERVAEAAVYYRRARELQPNYEPTLLGLAFVDLVQGRPQEAIPKLEKYLGSHPENRSAKRYLSQAYAAVGRNEDADAVQQMIDEEDRARGALPKER
jgi:hypothetical protein